MQSLQGTQGIKHDYQIILGLSPSLVRSFGKEKWRPVKDLMRLALDGPEPEHGDVKGVLGLWPFKNEVDARRALDFVQGLDWNGIVLEAWLMRRTNNHFEQIKGPVDPTTGSVLLAPVPRVTQKFSDHGFNESAIPPSTWLKAPPPDFGPDQTAPTVYTSDPLPRQTLPAPAPAMPIPSSHMEYVFIPCSTYHAALADAQWEGYWPLSWTHMNTPQVSNTSRSSSDSNLSNGPLHSDISNQHTAPNFCSTPSMPRTPFNSRNASLSSSLVASITPGIVPREYKSTLSSSQQGSQYSSPGCTPAQSYKVIMKNLTHETTMEQLCDLLEEKVRRYVPYTAVQIREVTKTRRRYAYIDFTLEADAERAVEQLNRHNFQTNKYLQVQLEYGGDNGGARPKPGGKKKKTSFAGSKGPLIVGRRTKK